MTFKKIHLVAIGILVFWIQGCATVPHKAVFQDNVLQDLCTRYGIVWNLDSVSQVITLSGPEREARAMVGSNLVVIGEEKIILNTPLKRKRDIVIVPSDFQSKVIEHLVKEGVAAIRRFRNIMVDPGHGGKDPGAIGREGLKEKDVTLDIALKLKKNLKEKGINILLTRTKDEFISLEGRAQQAHKAKADLFVSIHVNASRARGAHGLEVYYLRDLDEIDKKDLYKTNNHKKLFDRFTMRRNSSTLDEILFDLMYSYKQSESRRLAAYMARQTSAAIDSKERGSFSSGFFVLKNTLIPAVLIEVGFLSNKNEERLLATGEHRQKIADAITGSIIGYDGQ